MENTQNLWEEIKQLIEIKIITSELQSTKRMPSVDQISEEYGVARKTAAKVLKSLCEEGIIMNHGAKTGYYVKPYVATKLKSKHIDTIKDNAEKMIAHAKSINAGYEEFKPIYDMLNEYMDSLSSSKEVDSDEQENIQT